MRAYFDIDGVFNAHYPPFPKDKHELDILETGWTEKEWLWNALPVDLFEQVPEHYGQFFHLCTSPELLEALLKLSQNPDVEIVWSTTWRKRAATFVEALGFEKPQWRYLDATWDRIIDKDKVWWKQELVAKDLIDNPVDKFIWVDDEFMIRPEAVAWAESLPGGKVLAPTAHLGVTKEQWSNLLNHLTFDMATSA